VACQLWYNGDGAHRVDGGGIEHQAVGGYLIDWPDGQPAPTVEGNDPPPGGYSNFTVPGSSFYGTAFFSRPTVYLVGCTGDGTGGTGGTGGGINNNQPHDCVNGGCVPKTTYNTPGKFGSLAACQGGCAKDSNCTGECVSSAEIAALQQAANKAQANCCK
jgi:hypothetical protein